MISSQSTEDVVKQDPIVDIAEDGDAVFIVGPSHSRIRAYSLLLKNASPVFKAMLAPSFKEGHQLAQAGSTEIELPEDDAEAVEIAFKTIHGYNDEIPETLSVDQVFQILLMADKYDCRVPLSFALECWLKRLSPETPEQLWTWAMATIIHCSEENFTKATSELAMRHAGSYLELVRADLALPHLTTQLRLAVMLTESRGRLRIKVLRNQFDTTCSLIQGDSSKSLSRVREIMHHTRGLDDQDLSDIFEDLSTESLANQLGGLGGKRTAFKDEIQRCKRECVKAGGLCLACVVAGEPHDTHC